jgi:flagellar motor switch protein FliM
MDDLLSDSEVSALLSEINTAEVGESSKKQVLADSVETNYTLDEKGRKIRTYDFNRPNRFSKDHMRTLEMLHEIFARAFTASVAGYLRTVAEIKVTSVIQGPFREYAMSLPRPDCIFILEMAPLEGSILLEMNPDLVLTLIDRILGGPGHSPTATRELTPIEQAVIEKVLSRGIENLKEAWEKVGEFTPKIAGYESTAQFVQIVAPNEIAAVIEFEVKVSDVTGKMSMCIPYVVVEPIITNLSAQKWFTVGKKEPTAETMGSLTKVMKETVIPIVVEVGETRFTVRDMLRLHTGDVVRLNSSPNQEITVTIENLIKFKGRPGISSRKKSIQITKVCAPDVDV